MRPFRLWLGATLLSAVALAGPAQAQGGGQPPPGLPPGFKMPSNEEIKQRVQQVIASSPEETIELTGVFKIKYKKVVTDPQKIAEQVGKQMGQGLPPGLDISPYLKQFEGQITEVLNESLQDFGKFEALVEVKIASKKIPVGEHKLGIQFEGERPKALIISSDALSKPVEIRLKTRPVDMQPELKIEVKQPKDMKAGAEKVDLLLKFMRFEAQTKTKLERGGAGGAAPAGGDKEEKEDKEEGAPKR
jgi:hypothetical protein